MRFLVLLGIATVAWRAAAVPKSRFVKDINVESVEKEWEDPEDEEWHEDTFEWKKKMKSKQVGNLDVEELSNVAKSGGDVKEMYLNHAAKSGDMHMSFVTLKKGACKTQKEAEELGARWRDLLKTDGLSVSLYPLSETELLYTEEDGRVMEARDFLLSQPEVEKFRWKDTDFTPDMVHKKKATDTQAKRDADAAGGSKKKGKKKGDKKKKRKAPSAAAPEAEL